jgi:hypothetical protein
MGGQGNASRRIPPPRPSPAGNNGIRTPTGLGVPVAPSFLELDDDEETITYAGQASPPPPSRPRESFHTAPVFPEDLIDEPVAATPVESNLHQIEANKITNTLAPSAPLGEVHHLRGEVHHLRIGVSSFPPESLRPEQVRPPPSAQRSFLARLLFFTIVVTVLLLIATEVSVVAHRPWLDPRPHVAKAFRFVAQKIPWDRIPKLP